MENKESDISLNSSIGKAKKSKKGIVIGIIIALVVVIAIGVGYKIYRQKNITNIAIGLSNIELTEELKSEMKNMAIESDSYFNTNKAENILTSQYGLLYSYKNKANVTIKDIVTTTDVPDTTTAEMDVLYIRACDALKENTDTKLGIYLSVNSSSGYYVVSPKGEENTFSEEEFRNMLMKYAPTHNGVRNPQKDSEEYKAITTAAGVSGEDMDIKHIACDDMYSVVVAGSVSNPSNIKEIALKNDNGWKIVNGDLAVSENSYLDINITCPDMDLGLMPIYNIADFGEIDTANMSKIVDSLVELNMITEADRDGIYACGCGRFAYVQTKGGKRLVGFINDDKQLEFNEATDISEVIAIMVQCQENPPVFIAKFQ